jgi:uncharacterized integral membrane protein
MVQQGPAPGSVSGAGGAAGSSGGNAARLGGGAIAAIAGGGLLLAFMLQNTQDVTFTFLFWSITAPLWLYTLVVAVLGSIVWIGIGVIRRHRRRKSRRDGRDD